MRNLLFGKCIIIRAVISICLFGILSFYLWTAFNGRPIELPSHSGNYYSRLTDALMHGHLHFIEKPSPKLLSLADPYDPSLNKPYRLHDVSLYKGNWYLYFGITPVLILWLPTRIFGIEMIDPLAISIFCWVGLLASLGFIRNIVYASNIKISSWMWLVVIILLAFNNSSPFLLRRPAFYETAISAAYCCLMLALYFYSMGYFNHVGSKLYLALGSLFLGLSVGARPNYLIWGLVLIIVSLKIYDRSSKEKTYLWLNQQVALWWPYIFIMTCLALYNYLRFDSFFEFGTKYQLAGINMKKISVFSISSLLPGLYFYLLQPLTFNKYFPFFHVLPSYPLALPQGYIGPEPVVGIFSLSPALYAIPLMGLFVIYKSSRISGYSGKVASVMIFLGFLQLFLVSFVLPSATMRYIIDFLPSMLISVVLIMFITNDYLCSQNMYSIKLLNNILFTVLVLYGAIANIGIGVVGYYNQFESSNPMSYYDLREKIGYILGKHCQIYHVAVDVNKKGESTQLVMYIGFQGKADLILINLKGKKVCIGIDHLGKPTTWSKWYVPSIPSELKMKVEISDSELNVITDDISLASPYAPYYLNMSPVLGKNDIGFSAANKVGTILVNHQRF